MDKQGIHIKKNNIIKNNHLEQNNYFLYKNPFIRKMNYLIVVILICFFITGCNNNKESNHKELDNITTILPSPSVLPSQSPEAEENESDSQEEAVDSEPIIEEVDYSDYFDGIGGSAVFYHSDTNTYKVYNKELSEKPASPCSTFKIITTIMGLEKGVVSSADSTMGYDGTLYGMDTWNQDLTLKEAFKESCVWYFRKVIDQLGESDVQHYLDQLKYGNCDISDWDGSGINPVPELNGFWLESTLEITPIEQVDVLAKIFEGKTDFSEKNIELLKEIMLVQDQDNATIYGKTGTGPKDETGNRDNGWFVGMFEKDDEQYYFAVHLTEESPEVSGGKAKEIALNIIQEYFNAK